MNNTIEAKETNKLISREGRSILLLILATITVTMISGILGAFKSGKLYKTYDFVEVNILLEEVDYTLEIFKDKTDNSREVIKYETEYIFSEELQESVPVKVKVYKGYYTKYFFESWWFYADAMTNSASALIFYVALFGYLLVKRLENNEIFLTLEEEINNIIIVENQLPAISFEPFIEKWNLARKIRQHISNIKYLLAKLEVKTPYKIRKTFYVKNGNGTEFIVPTNDLTWREERYLNKKERLESYLTKEYIDEHVEFERVKHFKYIHPSFITTGVNKIIKSTDEYSSIKTDQRKTTENISKKAMLSIASSFVVASLLSFVLFRLEEGWLEILFNVALRMLPLVLQVILSNSDSNRFIKNQIITNQRNRLNIINIYLVTKNEEEEIIQKEEEKIIQKEEIPFVKEEEYVGN